MAVDPRLHRHGVGRALVSALVSALERDLIADGARFHQVKTLCSAHPDPGYLRPRQSYAAAGFTHWRRSMACGPVTCA